MAYKSLFNDVVPLHPQSWHPISLSVWDRFFFLLKPKNGNPRYWHDLEGTGLEEAGRRLVGIKKDPADALYYAALFNPPASKNPFPGETGRLSPEESADLTQKLQDEPWLVRAVQDSHGRPALMRYANHTRAPLSPHPIDRFFREQPGV